MMESIYNYQFLQIIHESYIYTIYNYLEKIYYLIKNNKVICGSEFISDLNNFVEVISKIYYPNNDAKCKIINCLKIIENLLQKSKIKKIIYIFKDMKDIL